MLNIIADENIAYPLELLGQFGKVTLLNGRHIKNSALRHADVLIVRSVTKVNEALLKGTNVKFVGTTTIGIDHLDTEYLNSRGIYYASAPGCNSYAVAEYVIAALFLTAVKNNFSLSGKSIGVVGIGNVGSKVVRFCEALGMKVLKNDPPLSRQGLLPDTFPINELLEADIITLHVPLTLDGPDKTFHFFDTDKLNAIKDGSIFINTARGEVVDNTSLYKIALRKNLRLILDVWTNEPYVDIPLINFCTIATPHIAGYTFEGKLNGTLMLCDALAEYLGKSKTVNLSPPQTVNSYIDYNLSGFSEKIINGVIKSVYNIEGDHKRLLEINSLSENQRSDYFDKLRKDYPLRREFNNYKIRVKNPDNELIKILEALRFEIISS